MEKTHQRPSEILFIKNELVAYCFDKAVVTFGQALENAVREGTKNISKQKDAEAKALRIVTKWLSSGPKGPLPGQFRQPPR